MYSLVPTYKIKNNKTSFEDLKIVAFTPPDLLVFLFLLQLLRRWGSRPSHHAGFGQQSLRGGALGAGTLQNSCCPEDTLCKMNYTFREDEQPRSHNILTPSSACLVVLWWPQPGAGSEEPHRAVCRYAAGTRVIYDHRPLRPWISR